MERDMYASIDLYLTSILRRLRFSTAEDDDDDDENNDQDYENDPN